MTNATCAHEPIVHGILAAVQAEHGAPRGPEVRSFCDRLQAALRDDRAAGCADPTLDEIVALVAGVENERGADVPPEIAAAHPHLDAVLDSYLT